MVRMVRLELVHKLCVRGLSCFVLILASPGLKVGLIAELNRNDHVRLLELN